MTGASVLLLLLVLSTLSLHTACSQSPANAADNSSAEAAKDQSHLPFHDASEGPAADADAMGSRQASDPQRTRLPFAASSVGTMPVGTLLTVRLDDALPGAKPKLGEAFTASLDDAVVVNGNTMLPRGTTVRGQVESVRPAVVNGNGGYLRLTLVSMRIDGREVPLETSSLFARGQRLTSTPAHTTFSPSKASNAMPYDISGPVYVEKGRLLTFRLASPVSSPAVASAHMSKNVPLSSE